jgi:hypothetical protein
MHDRFGGDIVSGARPVLNEEWLTEPLRKPLTDQAGRMCRTLRREERLQRCPPAATDRLEHSRCVRWQIERRPRPQEKKRTTQDFHLCPHCA